MMFWPIVLFALGGCGVEKGLPEQVMLSDGWTFQSTDGRWDVRIWGRNLTDEEYIMNLGNAAVPGNFGIRGSKVVYFGLTATYGLGVTMNFYSWVKM